MQVYYRIDQEELENRGLGHKSELEKESGSLGNLHQFSMLQRFRKAKDFRAPDRYKPKNQEEASQIKEQEAQWWRQNAQTDK